MKRSSRLRRADRDDRGYVLVLIAVCLTVLLASVGFSIDVGSWYHEAVRFQNAADAAALAGVIYMPDDLTTATATAVTTLSKNGITAGGNISVTIGGVMSSPRRLEVCVNDAAPTVYFSRMVGAHPRIHKCAVAEYVLPVQMGSPLNELDTATIGLYPAINGRCSASEDGDEINSSWTSLWNGGTYLGCPGSVANQFVDTRGYYYGVDVTDSTQNVNIEIYDAAYVPSTIDGPQGPAPTVVDTTYEVLDDNNTPLNPDDDTPLAGGTLVVPSNAPGYQNTWVHLATIPSGSHLGRYRIHVSTPGAIPNEHGSNSFGIRATLGASFSLCSTIIGDPLFQTGCPQVFAENNLGVNAHSTTPVGDFYLADVDDVYAGHEMVVGLFDPAEGGRTIEVLDPNGNAVDFDWKTTDNWPVQYSGSGNILDVSGSASTPLPLHRNNGKFNDRKLELSIDLPGNYAALYGTKTWWKLRYTFFSVISDRTTWDVQIVGDPVHLVLD